MSVFLWRSTPSRSPHVYPQRDIKYPQHNAHHGFRQRWLNEGGMKNYFLHFCQNTLIAPQIPPYPTKRANWLCSPSSITPLSAVERVPKVPVSKSFKVSKLDILSFETRSVPRNRFACLAIKSPIKTLLVCCARTCPAQFGVGFGEKFENELQILGRAVSDKKWPNLTKVRRPSTMTNPTTRLSPQVDSPPAPRQTVQLGNVSRHATHPHASLTVVEWGEVAIRSEVSQDSWCAQGFEGGNHGYNKSRYGPILGFRYSTEPSRRGEGAYAGCKGQGVSGEA